MKKILLIIYVVAGLVIASPQIITKGKNHDLNDNEHMQLNAGTSDPKISIEVKKDGSNITINHTSKYDIKDAVIEYVVVEESKNISRLDTFPVNSKGVAVVPNGTIAVKVHQLIVEERNTTYRYATENITSVPMGFNWSNVQRKNITEIETKAINILDTKYSVSYGSMFSKKVFEFYFDFTKQHDSIISIDVDYVLIKKFLGIIETKRLNVYEKKLAADKVWRVHAWGMPDTYTDFKALEKNFSSFDGTHVARISPWSTDYDGVAGEFFTDSVKIENFAIIRIEYEIDGEFFIDDVINDPWTGNDKLDETLDWLIKFISNLQNSIKDFIVFFTENMGTIGVIILFIIGIILIGPILFLIKGISGLMKLIFKGLKTLLKIPGKILELFKWLFVPKKKQKKYKN